MNNTSGGPSDLTEGRIPPHLNLKLTNITNTENPEKRPSTLFLLRRTHVSTDKYKNQSSKRERSLSDHKHRTQTAVYPLCREFRFP